MSSLTVEELKKILAENGVALPSGRMRKEDYVQLYEEHILNMNGTPPSEAFSDDESQNSRRVSSTNTFDSQLFDETVRTLTDDELFQKLNELGYNAGPIVPSSRSIYEKKLVKLVKEIGFTNGGEENTNGEFSDQEERPRTPPPSPPPRQVSVPPPEVPPRQPSVSRRYTFVEKISRVSKERTIQPISSDDDDVRFRATSDTSDVYKGRWSPSATLKSHTSPTVKDEPRSNRVLFIIGGLVLAAAVILGAYLLLPAADQYQLLEEDAVKHAAATGSQTV